MSETTAEEKQRVQDQRHRTHTALKALVRETFVALGLIIGACGFLLGPAVEAKDQPEMQLFLVNTLWLFIAVALSVTAGAWAFSTKMLVDDAIASEQCSKPKRILFGCGVAICIMVTGVFLWMDFFLFNETIKSLTALKLSIR